MEMEVQTLNDELSQREEQLFEYSGKMYNLEQRIENNKAQVPMQLEKLDIDWQNRHD